MIYSPFADLRIDHELVCEFYGTFARFEYAMKTVGFRRADKYKNAQPDWDALKGSIGGLLTTCDVREVVDAIRFVTEDPPQIQIVENEQLVFRARELRGENNGEKAIEAVKRIRNNLFHGGKHTNHSPPDRDQQLVKSAMVILDACLQLEPCLRDVFTSPQDA